MNTFHAYRYSVGTVGQILASGRFVVVVVVSLLQSHIFVQSSSRRSVEVEVAFSFTVRGSRLVVSRVKDRSEVERVCLDIYCAVRTSLVVVHSIIKLYKTFRVKVNCSCVRCVLCMVSSAFSPYPNRIGTVSCERSRKKHAARRTASALHSTKNNQSVYAGL